eukprot:6548521-Alexandrium_andersonii.AAC.1
MGGSALTERLGTPCRGAPICRVTASAPTIRHSFGGSEGAPVSLCGGGLPGESAIVARPPHRLY